MKAASSLQEGGNKQLESVVLISEQNEFWYAEPQNYAGLPTQAQASVEPPRPPHGALSETQQEEEGQRQVTPVGRSPPRRERQRKCSLLVQVQFLLPVTIRYIIPLGRGAARVVSLTQKHTAGTRKGGSLLTVMF